VERNDGVGFVELGGEARLGNNVFARREEGNGFAVVLMVGSDEAVNGDSGDEVGLRKMEVGVVKERCLPFSRNDDFVEIAAVITGGKVL